MKGDDNFYREHENKLQFKTQTGPVLCTSIFTNFNIHQHLKTGLEDVDETYTVRTFSNRPYLGGLFLQLWGCVEEPTIKQVNTSTKSASAANTDFAMPSFSFFSHTNEQCTSARSRKDWVGCLCLSFLWLLKSVLREGWSAMTATNEAFSHSQRMKPFVCLPQLSCLHDAPKSTLPCVDLSSPFLEAETCWS